MARCSYRSLCIQASLEHNRDNVHPLFPVPALSHWQYERAQEKTQLRNRIQTFSNTAHHQNLTLSELLKAYDAIGPGLSDAPATITGHFKPDHTLLWDNRIHQHQAGFYVLGFFSPNTHTHTLLVNYGWHPLIEGKRAVLPKITWPNDIHTLKGTLYVPQLKNFSLAPETLTIDTFTSNVSTSEKFIKFEAQSHVIQHLDIPALEKTLSIKLFPFILQLDAASINNTRHPLSRDWLLKTQFGPAPEKHMGYAAQWLIFSILLIGLYFFLNLKKYPLSGRSLNPRSTDSEHPSL